MKQAPRASKPNILYILADDMGYGDLSCLNARSAWRTPALDRIAAEGLTCRDAHASSAVCTPSRYSILTGRYNWRSRLKQGVLKGWDPPLIEPGRETVASLLGKAGYLTGCVGKWHLGWHWAEAAAPGTVWREKAGDLDGLPGHMAAQARQAAEAADRVDWEAPITGGPCDAGFDRFFGVAGSLDMPPYTYLRDRRVEAVPDRWDPGGDDRGLCTWGGKDMHRPGPAASGFRFEDCLGRLTGESLHFIDEAVEAGRPFFLYHSLAAPHTPIVPSAPYEGISGTSLYGDFCVQVDAEAGRLLEHLERRGLSENTLVVFTSDNGASPQADFEELALFGHRPSHIFRGTKADIFEGGHRVPLLMRWPEGIAPGSVTDETLCLVDLMATCAELAGLELAADAGEDSVSHLPVWRGESLDPARREAIVHHSVNGSFSIRKGRWKLELCPDSGGWSYPRPGVDATGHLPAVQLYDLEADVRERRNLAPERPETVEELRTLLARYVAEGRSTPGPPLANEPPAKDAPWPGLHWLAPGEAAGLPGIGRPDPPA